MKIYKITEASGYLGASINTLKTIAIEDTQKIVGANKKLVKELRDGTNTISK
jgi:hypothetical protein